MSIQTRIPEGVPTGGQFAASARREAVVALSESPLMAHAHDLGRGQSLAVRIALINDAAQMVQAEAEERAEALRTRLRTASSTRLSERLAQTREAMTETRAETLRARLISANTSNVAESLVTMARQRAMSVDRLSNDQTVTPLAS